MRVEPSMSVNTKLTIPDGSGTVADATHRPTDRQRNCGRVHAPCGET
jgi:hypothetical protein